MRNRPELSWFHRRSRGEKRKEGLSPDVEAQEPGALSPTESNNLFRAQHNNDHDRTRMPFQCAKRASCDALQFLALFPDRGIDLNTCREYTTESIIVWRKRLTHPHVGMPALG